MSEAAIAPNRPANVIKELRELGKSIYSTALGQVYIDKNNEGGFDVSLISYPLGIGNLAHRTQYTVNSDGQVSNPTCGFIGLHRDGKPITAEPSKIETNPAATFDKIMTAVRNRNVPRLPPASEQECALKVPIGVAVENCTLEPSLADTTHALDRVADGTTAYDASLGWQQIASKEIRFPFGSSKLTRQQFAEISTFLQEVRNEHSGDIHITVSGFASKPGAEDDNKVLSLSRANAVLDVIRGIDIGSTLPPLRYAYGEPSMQSGSNADNQTVTLKIFKK